MPIDSNGKYYFDPENISEKTKRMYEKDIGRQFGDYVVEEVWHDNETHKRMWRMRCTKCGKIIERDSARYRINGSKCICECTIALKKDAELKVRIQRENERERRRAEIELAKLNRRKNNNYADKKWIGSKYNHLTIKRYVNGKFICTCDCGREVELYPLLVVKGRRKTCANENCTYLSPFSNKRRSNVCNRLKTVWNGMIKRCYNEDYKDYKNYGGRGIKMCDEWKSDYFSFQKWAFDNGYDKDAPFGQCTIDRINNDGNYEPSNCRWVTMLEQANNRRRHVFFTDCEVLHADCRR